MAASEAVIASVQAPQPDTRLDGLNPGEEIEVAGNGFSR